MKTNNVRKIGHNVFEVESGYRAVTRSGNVITFSTVDSRRNRVREEDYDYRGSTNEDTVSGRHRHRVSKYRRFRGKVIQVLSDLALQSLCVGVFVGALAISIAALDVILQVYFGI